MQPLGLVVPMLNEAAVCASVVRALHAALDATGAPFHLVLVDNGSSDGTSELVRDLAAALPRVQTRVLEANHGYGGGILAGLEVLDTPLAGWHWGDGQVDPAVVVEAWRILDAGPVDLVAAHRVRRDDGWSRVLQSHAYHVATRLLLGLSEPDLHGCPKLFTREVLNGLALRSTDWLLDLEVHVKARDRALRIRRVPAVMRRRAGGRSKVSMATSLDFARAILAIQRGRVPWETR